MSVSCTYPKAGSIYAMPHAGLTTMSIERVALYPAARCCAMATRRGRRRMVLADRRLAEYGGGTASQVSRATSDLSY